MDTSSSFSDFMRLKFIRSIINRLSLVYLWFCSCVFRDISKCTLFDTLLFSHKYKSYDVDNQIFAGILYDYGKTSDAIYNLRNMRWCVQVSHIRYNFAKNQFPQLDPSTSIIC